MRYIPANNFTLIPWSRFVGLRITMSDTRSWIMDKKIIQTSKNKRGTENNVEDQKLHVTHVELYLIK